MRIKHRRYRVYPPYGLGYCGGARPQGPLPIQRRPTGLRRLFHWGAQKITNTARFLFRTIKDGIDVLAGTIAISDFLQNGGANTPPAMFALMTLAGITALSDVVDFTSWLRNTDPTHEEQLIRLSEEIQALQELLAGRIRLVNNNVDPTPDEAAANFAAIAQHRGESPAYAAIGANAVRGALLRGETLANAVTAGTQAIMEERYRNNDRLVGYGRFCGGKVSLESLATFFDWLRPIFKMGYEHVKNMKGGAIGELDIRDFCIKGAQQGWTMEDFDKGMRWFM